MTTDEYVPSDDEMREAYVWLSAGDNEGAREQATEDFNRGLARVRRDAAREALAVLADMYPHGADEYVLTAHRDHYYPEEAP